MKTQTDKYRQRAVMNALAILVVLVLIGALFLVVQKIRASVSPQNCHMAGFWNCSKSTIDLPPRPTGKPGGP